MVEPLSRASFEQMKVDLDSLKEFESSILEVLKDLTTGSISAIEPMERTVAFADYGTGFHEAYAMGWSTFGVVEHVKELAAMLRQQIEAMALTIRMAADTTVAADDGARSKLSTLLYGTEVGKQPYTVKPGTQPASTGTATAAGTGSSATQTAGTG